MVLALVLSLKSALIGDNLDYRRTLSLGNAQILVTNTFGKSLGSMPGAGKSMDPDDLSTKQARVLMDYDAVLPSEITVKENDILIVYRLPGMDPEFVMAEKGGSRGKVPISYLEIL